MIKTKKNYLFLFLILFSAYCAISIGQAWDEGHLLLQGKVVTNYLLSLGYINEEIFAREYYSPIYYSLKYLFIQIFSTKYQIEANHLTNLFFSLCTIIGIKKLSKELFNDKVSIIVFLILFFFPAFNGHMGFNSKDTILALCHVWIFYLSIKYLKNQHIKKKSNNYINYIAILASVGSGINLYFLGSLIPLFVFLILDFFIFKKIVSKKFNSKRLLVNLLYGVLIFYLLLVIFWIDTHQNIIILPLKLFLEWFSHDFPWVGYPYILVNGDYYLYNDIPKSYLFINIIFRSPEYFLLLYTLFPVIILTSISFYKKKFSFFNYKLGLLFSMIIFPFCLLYFTPFSIYDGLRHVLWMLPYLCIIPALVIYYLLENIKNIKEKITLSFTSLLIIYFLFNFFLITPYQYTYLNAFNGKIGDRYKKFENDYWGASLKELIKKMDLDKASKIKFATCGINQKNAEYYLRKNGYSKLRFGNEKNSTYIIMTNRVTLDKDTAYKSENLTNCFDKFPGKDVFKVKRNGVILSVIRQIN